MNSVNGTVVVVVLAGEPSCWQAILDSEWRSVGVVVIIVVIIVVIVIVIVIGIVFIIGIVIVVI